MEYGEDGEVKTYSYNTLSSSERSVSSGSKDVSDRAVSYGTDRFGNINSVVGDDGNGEANVGDSVYTHGLLTRVKSGSADIKSGTVDGAINGLIDGAIDGVMWGGIFAGGAQILSGGFKIAAKLGVKTGIKGGIKISKHVKILSPNHLKHYEGWGTLIKIGNLARKGKNIRIDVGAESLLHLNIQFRKNFHILFGKYLSGIIGVFYEWEI